VLCPLWTRGFSTSIVPEDGTQHANSGKARDTDKVGIVMLRCCVLRQMQYSRLSPFEQGEIDGLCLNLMNMHTSTCSRVLVDSGRVL
jgi:hypothetical protein